MKHLVIKTAILLLSAIFTTNSFAQEVKKDEISHNPNATIDSSKKSIKAAAIGKIGKANVTVNYHSPGVRKRVIWGGLVPYNDVWVTGAHSATNLVIDKPVKVEGKLIPAGKYALFTIPGEDEWTVIINKNWEQHLTDDYNMKDDLVRVKVKPIKKDSTLERLQYFITKSGDNKGTIAMEWEKVRVELPIEL
jgi:hypothetical protein